MPDDIPKVFFNQPQKETFAFEVITLKHLFAKAANLPVPPTQPHQMEFYQILYISKGRGRHYIDFKPYKYARGTIFFISAGQVHAYEQNPEADGLMLLFTEDFLTQNMVHSDILSLSRLYNYHLYPPDIQAHEASEVTFSPILNEIYNEYTFAQAFAKEEIIRTLLKLLLLKAERVKRTLTPKERNSGWLIHFGKFRQLLTGSFVETRNADAYADMMNISYNHLNKIVKAVTGKTAKSFIDDFVILEIKRQLAVTDTSVKELTYAMGFDEPTNFVKYFKRHTGKSPVQFKKEITRARRP